MQKFSWWGLSALLGLSIQLSAQTVKNKLPFPSELVNFTPYEGNPVFAGTGNPADWDERIRERGFILHEEGEYRMWYTGYDKKTGATRKYLGYATSPDGFNWTRYAGNPIHRDHWIEDMYVLKSGKTYYMFAESKDDIPRMFTSTDRIHWKDHGRLDVRMVNGQPISEGPYGTPTVLKKGKTWYLFYERNDAAVWLATSTDLKVWKHVQDDPVLNPGPEVYDKFGVAFNQIIEKNGVYYAYYHGTAFEDWHEWSTNVAASKDLIHWEKYAGNPIVGDDTSSGIPVPDGKGYRLYTMHPNVKVFFPKK
jgi:predicted GH43/DUF377 family glycosyl hydrolase